MKTFTKIMTIALFTTALYSCTPQEIEQNDPHEIHATGGDTAAEVDTDKD